MNTGLAQQRRILLLATGLLGLLVIVALGAGALRIPPLQCVAILLAQVGVESPWAFDDSQRAVLLHLRLPRVLMAMLIGAALSVSGALLQGLFRNPLADPSLIGVSSGAALGVAIVMVLGSGVTFIGAGVLGVALLPLAAFVGGGCVVVVVWRLASRMGRTQVATLLLAGIAVTSLAEAGIGVLTYVAEDAELRSLTFWRMGSLNGISWTTIAASIPFLLIGVLVVPRFCTALDALLLGEREAGHLGIDVESLKRKAVVVTALAVGASVAAAGNIGFVGLVVPHLARLTGGPRHRWVLPASALLGAIVLVAADLVARTIVAPSELPIGLVTALLGAPFFLWLIGKEQVG